MFFEYLARENQNLGVIIFKIVSKNIKIQKNDQPDYIDSSIISNFSMNIDSTFKANEVNINRMLNQVINLKLYLFIRDKIFNGYGNLYPINTPLDGDCLLHAISLVQWGIIDNNQLLRKVLINTIKKPQVRDKFFECVNNNEATNNRDTVDSLTDITDAIDIKLEWDREIQMIASGHLGEISIMILSHILRRTIIVYGTRYVYNGSQENQMLGIYCPILWDSSMVSKTPIVLFYMDNHFWGIININNSNTYCLPCRLFNDKEYSIEFKYLGTPTSVAQISKYLEIEKNRDEVIIVVNKNKGEFQQFIDINSYLFFQNDPIIKSFNSK